ncbi:MAG TPA: hypothetical protein VGM91_20790 [Conexibacter sp.]
MRKVVGEVMRAPRQPRQGVVNRQFAQRRSGLREVGRGVMDDEVGGQRHGERGAGARQPAPAVLVAPVVRKRDPKHDDEDDGQHRLPTDDPDQQAGQHERQPPADQPKQR